MWYTVTSKRCMILYLSSCAKILVVVGYSCSKRLLLATRWLRSISWVDNANGPRKGCLRLPFRMPLNRALLIKSFSPSFDIIPVTTLTLVQKMERSLQIYFLTFWLTKYLSHLILCLGVSEVKVVSCYPLEKCLNL